MPSVLWFVVAPGAARMFAASSAELATLRLATKLWFAYLVLFYLEISKSLLVPPMVTSVTE